MTSLSRRNAIKAVPGSAIASSAHAASGSHLAELPMSKAAWGSGQEGQRKADLRNGTCRKPIISGDRPDPTILKDGANYYMTFPSFLSYPGMIIWHSTDLFKPLGTIRAFDLCKHDNCYYIYIPTGLDNEGRSIYAIRADDIAGPWSDPVDLKIAGAIRMSQFTYRARNA